MNGRPATCTASRCAPYDRDEAAAYVEQYRPLDCVGSYRLEDDADLIESVEGSGRSGVIGLPLDVVRDLLDLAGVNPSS